MALFPLTFSLLPALAFAGQSLVLNPAAPPITVADPVISQKQSWRIEFQVHDWSPTSDQSKAFFHLDGLGAFAYFYPDGRIAVGDWQDQSVERQPCFLQTKGRKNVLVRMQRDTAKMRFTCEIWNHDGTGYQNDALTLGSIGVPQSGGGTIGGGVAASLGFLRVFTDVVAQGGRPPVTADTGDYTDYKFDGNLNDSSRRGHGATGQATYAPTPGQVPVSLPKTDGAPVWTNAVSVRAGFPARLDGSASYTLADGNSAVAYRWRQISGPTKVVWQDQNGAKPTIKGLVFGDYVFSLQVTDAAGGTAETQLEVGAVATDANGVVVNANPAADILFGPMIAFGKNPWAWADERNLAMENLQKNTYATPPSWSKPAESQTVSYRFFVSPRPRTTVAAEVTGAALTIPVANAAALDLSAFPTQLLIGGFARPEVVRICGVSGNALTVCYDGRGFHAGHWGSTPPKSWPPGTAIWQTKVHGTDTHFLTTMCSFGPGYTVARNHAVTSAGSVTMTPGSAAVKGVGTKWDGTQNSLSIAVTATHAGGAKFTFLANVVSASGESMTLTRPYPPDADAGSFSYRIFSDQRNVVLHYRRSDGSDGSIFFGTAGCESDTDLYLDSGWDNAYSDQLVSASPYSWMDGFGYKGDVSPNYYDMGLAHYAFYFRSGLSQALNSARNLEDYWIHYPELAQGDGGGAPRQAAVLGAFAAAVLDGDRGSNWSGLRSYAGWGVRVAKANNCDDDPRESAYELTWLALAALFDPDPAQRKQWHDAMPAAYARDSHCKGPDNSYPAPYWNPDTYPKVVVRNGSQEATPATGSFPKEICPGTAQGTASVVAGSATITALTGTFVPPTGTSSIIVGGTRNGIRYDLSAQFHYDSPGKLTMSVLWPGDTGTVYWMISVNDGWSVATIAAGTADPNFGQFFNCSKTDSTHIVLHRPWPGASGTYSFYSSNLVGWGTQPFMMGIKALQMRYAALAYEPYKKLGEDLSKWVGTVGFDAANKAISYGRGFPVCEPTLKESGIADAGYRTLSCVENSYNRDAVTTGRARNGEAQNAMTVNYLANPTEENRRLGDLFYGAAYGAPGFTAPGYFSDGITSSNLENNYLAAYKWPGFFFGIGMAHQWPAARVGGVAPPKYRTVQIPFTPDPAATARVILVAPSGAVTGWKCGSNTCSVNVDDRQGAHWFRIQFMSAEGKVLRQVDPELLAGPE